MEPSGAVSAADSGGQVKGKGADGAVPVVLPDGQQAILTTQGWGRYVCVSKLLKPMSRLSRRRSKRELARCSTIFLRSTRYTLLYCSKLNALPKISSRLQNLLKNFVTRWQFVFLLLALVRQIMVPFAPRETRGPPASGLEAAPKVSLLRRLTAIIS